MPDYIAAKGLDGGKWKRWPAHRIEWAMECYAFGGVLALMACAFGWGAFCDRHRWRRPWWGWLCGASGVLSLGSFAGSIWTRGDAPGSAWWLVLALALTGGLVRSVHMHIKGVEFTSTDLSSVSAFRSKCDDPKHPLDANTLLGDLDILRRLARCPDSQAWAKPLLKETIAQEQRTLDQKQRAHDQAQRALDQEQEYLNYLKEALEEAPPGTPDMG